MKFIKLSLYLSFVFFLNFNLFSLENSYEKEFVKGSLTDKTSILQKSDTLSSNLIQKALDFIIENATLLNSDSEFISFAQICISKVPEDLTNLDRTVQKNYSEHLMAIFKIANDATLKNSIMNKLSLYAFSDINLSVDFFNDYLLDAYKSNEKAENVSETAIKLIGKIGNNDSITIIYNIWVSKIWESYKLTIDNALVNLTENSFADAIKIISVSNPLDSGYYLKLLKNSSSISKKNLCDIAENALLLTINNIEKLSAQERVKAGNYLELQIMAHEILCENKWSHASSVINRNIILAKKSYDEKLLSEESFVKMINTSVYIPSKSLAKSLNEMLSECNGKIEKDDSLSNENMPARDVVLALITSLGVLGDKTAFDTLLYVTYLSYPLEITDEAKKSLAKLKW